MGAMTGAEAKEILLRERIAADPSASMRCLKCKTTFPLNGIAGPSWRCPRCGHEEPADDVWQGSLRYWREGQEEQRKAVMAVIEKWVKCMGPGRAVIEFKCMRCGGVMDGVQPCPECRSPGRAMRYFCNGTECATAAEALALAWTNLGPSDRQWACFHCGGEYTPVSDTGPAPKCPHCGHIISEKDAEEALTIIKIRQDAIAEIDQMAQLLGEPSEDLGGHIASCRHCRRDLPSVPSHSEIDCPHCGKHAYVFKAESFKGIEECQKVMRFRLQKKQNLGLVARNRAVGQRIVEAASGCASDQTVPGGGLLYVLVNSAMPGLVKVGRTERDAEARARELSSSTGVPTPFLVAYEESFDDCSDAERQVHRLLESQGYRIADNREFFCVPVKAAIQAIMETKQAHMKASKPQSETGTV